MNRIALVVLAGALLLLAAGRAASEPPVREAIPFCPECWVFLEVPGSLDMKGYCAGCGKYPTELNTQRMEWFWCARGKAWRRAPCGENWMRRCCAGEESLAEVVPPGVPLFEAWFCPAHQSFDVLQVPILAQRRCKVCARPAVLVNARERAWFWCETEGVWGSAPCAMNGLRKCCAKREGILPVRWEAAPIAK